MINISHDDLRKILEASFGKYIHFNCTHTEKSMKTAFTHFLYKSGEGKLIPELRPFEAFLQLPGITDYEGNPIFEGSIIRHNGHSTLAIVKYDTQNAQFYVSYIDGETINFSEIPGDHFKVLGHILKYKIEDFLITKEEKDLIAQSLGYKSAEALYSIGAHVTAFENMIKAVITVRRGL